MFDSINARVSPFYFKKSLLTLFVRAEHHPGFFDHPSAFFEAINIFHIHSSHTPATVDSKPPPNVYVVNSIEHPPELLNSLERPHENPPHVISHIVPQVGHGIISHPGITSYIPLWKYTVKLLKKSRAVGDAPEKRRMDGRRLGGNQAGLAMNQRDAMALQERREL